MPDKYMPRVPPKPSQITDLEILQNMPLNLPFIYD